MGWSRGCAEAAWREDAGQGSGSAGSRDVGAALALDEPSRPALAYQGGDRSALGALYRAVGPLLGAALARYQQQPGSLPSGLDCDDLAQQSWLILAELAVRWKPSGGSFAAYFRVSFRWALARYVRRNSPSRRARGVI